MIFSEMQGAIQPLLNKIHQHPFNQELSRGTLLFNTFTYYLQQDALYLAEFSRALAITAARLESNDHSLQFIRFSLEAIQSEKELHHYYLQRVTYPVSAEANPSCFMYTNYLLRMVSLASVEEAVACLLPCFYVYNEVSKQMVINLHSNTDAGLVNPYQNWIDLYSTGSFEVSVQAVIAIVNALGQKCSLRTCEKMQVAFMRATQLEWLFWESAYHHEMWQV